MVALVARMGKTRNIYKYLVGNLRGKRPVGRPGCVSEIDINLDLIRNVVDCTALADDMAQRWTVASPVMSLRCP